MYVAILKHRMDYSSWHYDWNVDDFYWFDVNKKIWIGDILTVTCVREAVIFMYAFYTEIVHIGTSNHTFWKIIPWILIVSKP